MKTFAQIRGILREHEKDLRQRYGITNLAVFGSVVRGEAREDSDVDIVADVPLSLNFIKLMEAELYIADLLGCDVDLIPRGEIRQEFRSHILDEAVAI